MSTIDDVLSLSSAVSSPTDPSGLLLSRPAVPHLAYAALFPLRVLCDYPVLLPAPSTSPSDSLYVLLRYLFFHANGRLLSLRLPNLIPAYISSRFALLSPC